MPTWGDTPLIGGIKIKTPIRDEYTNSQIGRKGKSRVSKQEQYLVLHIFFFISLTPCETISRCSMPICGWVTEWTNEWEWYMQEASSLHYTQCPHNWQNTGSFGRCPKWFFISEADSQDPSIFQQSLCSCYSSEIDPHESKFSLVEHGETAQLA